MITTMYDNTEDYFASVDYKNSLHSGTASLAIQVELSISIKWDGKFVRRLLGQTLNLTCL